MLALDRPLALLLGLTAVVGAVGGTVVAVALTGEPAQDPAPRTTPAAVLWADRDGLHDGDVTVDLDLVDPPASVQRVADGWVITQSTDASEDTAYQASVVRSDGSVTFLAQTYDFGDVSPDGTRYLAATEDAYVVWDLATGETTDTVDAGRSPGQRVVGGAQYVDADTIATTWAVPATGPTEVLVSDLGSSERRLLADDVVGDWGISPDGAWFVGSLEDTRDGRPAEGCTLVRPVDGSGEGTRDCGGSVDGVPTFTPDSGAVLTNPRGFDGLGPGEYRPLALDGRAQPPRISTPDEALDGVYVGLDRIAVLSPVPVDPEDAEVTTPGPLAEGTPLLVLRCGSDTGCETVGRTTVGAVLGR